jgi:ribosomal protein S27AE
MGWWEALRTRRRARRWRVRLTWQVCRRCGSYAFMPAIGDRLCGSCRSLQ